MASCMFIVCTLDEARNLPESLFGKFHTGKQVLKRYSLHNSSVVITVYEGNHYVSMVARGCEPDGVDVYKYTDKKAQEKLLEIMLCG